MWQKKSFHGYLALIMLYPTQETLKLSCKICAGFKLKIERYVLSEKTTFMAQNVTVQTHK